MTALWCFRSLRLFQVFWIFRGKISVQCFNSLYLMSIVLQQVWVIEINMFFFVTIVAQYWELRLLWFSVIVLFWGCSRGSPQFLIYIKSEGNNNLMFSVRDLCKMWFLFLILNWFHFWFIFFQSLQLLCIINQSIVINREYWHFLNFPL